MSSETQPISPARFAEALKELPASSLALKVLELRNAIAHLDYSNEELRPFAEGAIPTLDQRDGSAGGSGSGSGSAGGAGQPDQDCKDAIAENEGVIARMQERIELIRAEVEGRGLSWQEFQGNDSSSSTADGKDGAAAATQNGAETTTVTPTVNGHGGESAGSQQHEAWRDGTIQTGTIRGDEELLRELLARMPPDNDDERDPDGGMHL